ncbi:MAG TPA: transglycosylase SLT domain-containing protein [Candidatus Paceibacterota bacterium]
MVSFATGSGNSTSMAMNQVQEYTIPELIEEISAHYGVDSTVALDIARCESRLQQFRADGSLVRGNKNPSDVGIFQINEKYHLEQSQTKGFDIYTPAGNIEYAMWLIKNDGDRHWRWSQSCWDI